MLKILTVIFCVSVLRARALKPGKFYSEFYSKQFPHQHLINLTENLCKDATYKLRMAEMLQEPYKINHGYELGMVTARIMAKFKHMIKIYRYYSNPRAYKNNDHALGAIVNAYAIVQGHYTELVAETVLFHKTFESRMKQDVEDEAKLKHLAKKHGMAVGGLRDLQKKGVDLKEVGIVRRSLQAGTNLPEYGAKPPQETGDIPRRFLPQDPVSKNINTWTPKKDNNTKEEEYKKNLRYTMWAEKWQGFDGDTEGVNIADTIARLGRANDSDFLLKELKGHF